MIKFTEIASLGLASVYALGVVSTTACDAHPRDLKCDAVPAPTISMPWTASGSSSFDFVDYNTGTHLGTVQIVYKPPFEQGPDKV